ncbi:TRAP transporter small permease subunit [Metallumcola ferriviriculae]|uniref:TRAP transporter small permease subunit n=1 Tax=Metallumcola ferriviriculae TaxID=3039180 RepID=A0AAU0URQ0_9FIRM|nr:TRAP transporter small permease subunit [Desulfitibacteraceae bacterium MK1]
MEKLVRLIDRISEIFGRIAGIMMLIGVALVLSEVVIRTFFDKTLYVTEEYTGYLMVAITFLGLAYTLKEKGHIRMVFLHKSLKGKAKILLELYAFIIGLTVFAIITYTSGSFFWDSVVSGSRSMQISETYLAIPQAVMPLGSFLVALQFIAEILRSIIKLKTGEIEVEEVESEALGR